MEGRKQDQGTKPPSPPKPPGNYGLSRLNATRHGILSKYILLPWEPKEEYEDLHLSLKQEYVPVGPTEEHLVEEIAGIIWRKGRLRHAETSAFLSNYNKLVDTSSCSIAESGLLAKQSLQFPNVQASSNWSGGSNIRTYTREDPSVKEVFRIDPAEVPRELKLAKTNLENIINVLKVLEPLTEDAYVQAFDTLLDDTQKLWEEKLNNKKHDFTTQDFQKFLLELLAGYEKRVAILSNFTQIMDQAHGQSYNTGALETLSRYEIFLDRKMEKTLSVLLKLQALRQERKKVEKTVE